MITDPWFWITTGMVILGYAMWLSYGFGKDAGIAETERRYEQINPQKG